MFIVQGRPAHRRMKRPAADTGDSVHLQSHEGRAERGDTDLADVAARLAGREPPAALTLEVRPWSVAMPVVV